MVFGIKNATIILVLLRTNKTMLTKLVQNMVKWPIYLIISNFNHKIWRLRVSPGKIIVGLILIYKGDLFNIKIEIYH